MIKCILQMEILLTFAFISSAEQHGIVFANTKAKLSIPTLMKTRIQPKCYFLSLNLPVPTLFAT